MRDEIHVKISTLRHNPDPGFKPLFGTDMITLTLKGIENGDMVDFEGTRCNCPASPSRQSDANRRSEAAGSGYFGGFGSFSAKPLKHFNRSSSSLKNVQSVTAFGAGTLAVRLGREDRVVAIQPLLGFIVDLETGLHPHGDRLRLRLGLFRRRDPSA